MTETHPVASSSASAASTAGSPTVSPWQGLTGRVGTCWPPEPKAGSKLVLRGLAKVA
jgi:hypothetical protein